MTYFDDMVENDIHDIQFQSAGDRRFVACIVTLNNGFTIVRNVRSLSNGEREPGYIDEDDLIEARQRALEAVAEINDLRAADEADYKRFAARQAARQASQPAPAPVPEHEKRSDKLSFSAAMAAMRAGYAVSREGWNSGAYLVLRRVSDPENVGGGATKPQITEQKMTGEQWSWRPTQADILAHDWRTFETGADQ